MIFSFQIIWHLYSLVDKYIKIKFQNVFVVYHCQTVFKRVFRKRIINCYFSTLKFWQENGFWWHFFTSELMWADKSISFQPNLIIKCQVRLKINQNNVFFLILECKKLQDFFLRRINHYQSSVLKLRLIENLIRRIFVLLYYSFQTCQN